MRGIILEIDRLRQTGPPIAAAKALRKLGEQKRHLRDADGARRAYEEAVAILRDCEDPFLLAHTVRHLGDVHADAGRLDAAESCYEEALALYRKHDNCPRLDLANAIRSMAVLKDERMLWEEARAIYAELGIEEAIRETTRRIEVGARFASAQRQEVGPMSTREFFVQRFSEERPIFERVIRALPQDGLNYKPHEKNTPARDIAWFLALEMRGLVNVIDKGEIHWDQSKAPDSIDDIAAEYEKQAAEVEKRVRAMDDAKWNSEAGMFYGGRLIKKDTVGGIAWFFLFDAVHHRGQLSAYLRPMGGKVPSIYGPSADSRG